MQPCPSWFRTNLAKLEEQLVHELKAIYTPKLTIYVVCTFWKEPLELSISMQLMHCRFDDYKMMMTMMMVIF